VKFIIIIITIMGILTLKVLCRIFKNFRKRFIFATVFEIAKIKHAKNQPKGN
jgi:hypothetical protein